MKILHTIFCALILAILFCKPVISQQLPQFSQYYANEFLINPAVAGYDGRTVINLAARKQWVGFTKYTPSSYILSLQGRILKSNYSLRTSGKRKTFRSGNKGRVGLGGIVYHDENGAIQRTGVQFSYAYHLFIRNSQLSFGLTGNVFQYKINSDRAELKDPDADPLSGTIGKSTLIPDAGVGINYMTQNAHIGVAVAQVFQSKVKIGNSNDFRESDETRLMRQYYIIGDYRYVVPRHNEWEIEPSALVLFNEELRFLADATIKAYYDRKYWIGLSGRTSGDLIIMAGLRYKNYYFGYSFDYGFNGLSKYSYGSHEICITAKFGDSARRYRWLERY